MWFYLEMGYQQRKLNQNEVLRMNPNPIWWCPNKMENFRHKDTHNRGKTTLRYTEKTAKWLTDASSILCFLFKSTDRSLKKQESSRKTSVFALMTMPKPLSVWITINCGKFWKRGEYQTTWPASWETCMQVRKHS